MMETITGIIVGISSIIVARVVSPGVSLRGSLSVPLANRVVNIVVVVGIVGIGVPSTISQGNSSLNLSLICLLFILLHNRVGIRVAKSITQGTVKSIVRSSIVESIVGKGIVVESTVGKPWVSLRVGISSRFSLPLANRVVNIVVVVGIVGIGIASTISKGNSSFSRLNLILIILLFILLPNRVSIRVAKSITQGTVKSIVGDIIAESIVGNSIVESIVGKGIMVESTVGKP